MKNQALEKIRQHLDNLRKEKESLVQQINNLKKKEDKTKSSLHHAEVKLLFDGLGSDNSHATKSTFHDLNELRHNRHDLHEEERLLKDLVQKLHAIEEKFISATYWMNYANTDDPLKQAEAQKRVFG